MIPFQMKEGKTLGWERGSSLVLSCGEARQTWLKSGWAFWNSA